ncbi:YdcF family protein [Microbulbifer sp. CAU 1566]|uniref:YdcF family protein n=1 Tax=Microbulbifer sp. CAU 1566 TaxID=2933269 RepID=UPI00200429AC|nr:YdcF family protein [Microbulbifer sp. CAU 1566]MCK7598246.1 YdcF family protein [Microbulbifer sp. CAU 1566]
MELQTALATLIMPPFAPLAGLLLALVLWFFPSSSPVAKLSLPLAILCFATLWVCATPAFSGWLGQRLVDRQLETPNVEPGAVVILGGGRYRDEARGSERLSATSLERVAWAVAESPEALPILVSGGRVYAGEKAPESDLMAGALEKLFNRSVTWRENCSRTTAENASNSAALLHDSGVETVLLVTHWWHMPRAAESFARAGIQVRPLPVGSPGELVPRAESGLLRWLPNAAALLRTQVYWRELVGDQWYRWRPMPERRSC